MATVGLTPETINQYQWQVADGVAKAVNPYFQDTRGEKGTVFDLHNGEYAEFERLYGSTRLNTNAPDGIYSGEAFEEPVWQYWTGGEWENEEHESEHLWSVSEGLQVRQFLHLKPSHLPAVLTTQPGEEWKDMYNKIEEYETLSGDWTILDRTVHLNVFIKGNRVYQGDASYRYRKAWHLIIPPAEQEAETVEQEPLVSFKFKHPDGTLLRSAFYSVDDLLKTSIEDIQDKTCTCECQPIGETNVVECNCIDYYEQFEYAGKAWATKHLQSTLTQKDQRIAELEREWISVDERKPDNISTVLIWTNISINPTLGYYVSDDWLYFSHHDNFWLKTEKHIKVVKWMPLPTPPQH